MRIYHFVRTQATDLGSARYGSNPLPGITSEVPTRIRAAAKSPAIEPAVLALARDQRGEGFVRTFGPAADIGAFERQEVISANGFD
jgi:hypothetical protein